MMTVALPDEKTRKSYSTSLGRGTLSWALWETWIWTSETDFNGSRTTIDFSQIVHHSLFADTLCGNGGSSYTETQSGDAVLVLNRKATRWWVKGEVNGQMMAKER